MHSNGSHVTHHEIIGRSWRSSLPTFARTLDGPLPPHPMALCHLLRTCCQSSRISPKNHRLCARIFKPSSRCSDAAYGPAIQQSLAYWIFMGLISVEQISRMLT